MSRLPRCARWRSTSTTWIAARAGEAVALSSEVPELIELLRQVRALLGDRTVA